MVHKEGFELEITGADASIHNAIAESPNKYLGNMVRCLLHLANLGPEYWSYALRHAVYIKNRFPHSYIKTTPFEALTGQQLDLINLRIFGSRLFVKKPGKRNAKLDHHTSIGIFMGYTATTKNVYYIDDTTNNVKMDIHALFDGAHFTVQSTTASLAAQALQRLGYANFDNEYKDGKFVPDHTLKIKRLINRATIPTQSTSQSTGLDIYHSGNTIVLSLDEMQALDTDISVEPPKDTYIRIAPRCGLANKHQLHVLADVIDADYRETIKVLLQNLGKHDIEITHGQRIAQTIYEMAVIPTIMVIDTLTETIRNSDGFGSTEINDTSSTPPSHTTDKSPSPHIPYNLIPCDENEITTSTPTHKPIDNIVQKTTMHPQTGVPIIFHAQLNVISKHLVDIKLNEEEQYV